MTGALYRKAFRAVMGRLDGGVVTIVDAGGSESFGTSDPRRPLQAQLHIHDARAYRAMALRGAIGAAESYAAGWWTCEDLTTLFRIFVRRIGHESPAERRLAWIASIPAYFRHLVRRNTKTNSRLNIRSHYDLGNEFFALYLDPTFTYSCGYFEHPEVSLEDASLAKLRRLAWKLELDSSHHVLEIGTGWGSFAILAAREFGCRVTTTTISKEQHGLATQRVRDAGLEGLVEVLESDYRDLQGSYDRVVSIEMIEAVGHENLPTFFGKCASLLKPGGAMALQAITMPERRYRQYLRSVDFIRHFIFPGSCCPSKQAMFDAMDRASDLRLVDLEEIGPHYATTLRMWREALDARWDDARALGYSEEQLRIWRFYFSYCEAGFAERHTGDVQMVLARPEWAGAVPRGDGLPVARGTAWR